MKSIIHKIKNNGFTLIELIVVMAIFLFVIGAAIGIFLSVIQYQRKILTEQELLNQISYTEEYMSKALRMAKTELNEGCLMDANNDDHPGYIYLLSNYNEGSGLYQGVKFVNQSETDPTTGNALCQEFFLDTDGVLKEKRGTAAPVAITPSDLHINSVRFSINGSDGSAAGTDDCTTNPNQCGACDDPNQCGILNADYQPRVTILLNISIPGDSTEPNRIIQTTVSQRNLNAR